MKRSVIAIDVASRTELGFYLKTIGVNTMICRRHFRRPGYRIASLKMLPDNLPVAPGAELPNQFGGGYGREDQHARKARDHISAGRALSGGRLEKGRILDELCAVTRWHRKHAIRALSVTGHWDRPCRGGETGPTVLPFGLH